MRKGSFPLDRPLLKSFTAFCSWRRPSGILDPYFWAGPLSPAGINWMRDGWKQPLENLRTKKTRVFITDVNFLLLGFGRRQVSPALGSFIWRSDLYLGRWQRHGLDRSRRCQRSVALLEVFMIPKASIGLSCGKCWTFSICWSKALLRALSGWFCAWLVSEFCAWRGQDPRSRMGI